CRAARRVGADRDGVRLAGARALHHQLAAERRHECRARRHHRHRLGIHRHQPAVRRALPHAGPEDPHAMSTTAQTRREWLLSDRPQSRLQAKLGRAYVTWRRFSGNGLALVGLGIIVALVLVAIFADLIAPYSPTIGDLKNARLLPPSATHWFGTDDLGRDI